MKVLILGATGSIGRPLVPQALALGHEVTVLVRDPSKLEARRERLRIVTGDALDPAAVDAAVRGQEAVIFSLGRSNHRAPTTMFSDATRILIHAMETQGVRRLVCITGIGAGDSRGHGGFLYDKIIYPWLTKETYADKDRLEALIRESSLDWIIVRPASFTNGPQRGNLRAVTDLKNITIRSISRADAAAFVLEQLRSDRYLRKTPLVGY
ncbi:MAG: SDR family oxidoreductase [Candidatus Acidiferrales bacterium]